MKHKMTLAEFREKQAAEFKLFLKAALDDNPTEAAAARSIAMDRGAFRRDCIRFKLK